MSKLTHEQLTIARILKVNHAGEYGAIRIYSGQLLISKSLYKDLVPYLSEILEHEIIHCKQFADYMPIRKTRPCGMIRFWGYGGYMLGVITALIGRNSIMACTAAIESAVHIHLKEQIHYLSDKDPLLQKLIQDIQVEELQHLDFALSRLKKGLIPSILDYLIRAFTDTVIWLSTWGDVTRMRKEIKGLA